MKQFSRHTPVLTRLLSHAWYQPDGCLIWRGRRMTPGGYGRLSFNGKSVVAHRVSYELFIGPIPDGLVLDHLCRQRACINPFHLEPVTGRENTARGICGNITHCPQGHEYTDENTYLYDGRRACRTCRAARRPAENGRRRVRQLEGHVDPTLCPGCGCLTWDGIHRNGHRACVMAEVETHV